MTTQQAQEYLVLPTDCSESDPDWDLFAIRVIATGKGRWKVTHRSRALHINGKDWENEALPSARTEKYLSTHRFTEVDALAAAHAIADTVTQGWRTWAEFKAWVPEHLAQKNLPSGN